MEQTGEPDGNSSSVAQRRFHLNAKTLFLTYPQCDLPREEALSLLEAAFMTRQRRIIEYLIASEKHADGTPHLHCFVKLNKAVNLKRPTELDLKNHHGNYQSCRSPEAVRRYCSKDGNFLTNITSGTDSQEGPWRKARKIVKEGGDLKEALLALEETEKTARDLTIYGSTISQALRSLKPVTELTSEQTLTSYGPLFQWDQAKHSLLLFGNTETGKTTLAKLLIPKALFVRHLDLLLSLTEEHGGVILDDMTFKHLHDEAQIALLDLQDETHIHVRYRVAVLPAKLPRIITSNKEPWEVVNMANPAIARRVLCVRWYGWDKVPMFNVE
ncbi:replication associated protein [Gopherus associated circular DNA virus 1]|uniref:replication associated protein n=1 Tax=Gopherus associated circular DNA virus 1 TaxID=2041419 RepID=UPI000EB68019|nr:replication associated protein [Gopherus associated circular DNA virus 1]ATG71340.1 replication associated protein [Gopherus associated circular DNA virus 1]